jgi:hypothetical protein
MAAKFVIEGIFKITNRGYFISAKLIDNNLNFKVTKNSQIGEVEITDWFDIPRALDENGKQRLDFFIIQMKNTDDKEKLKEGQIVELVENI